MFFQISGFALVLPPFSVPSPKKRPGRAASFGRISAARSASAFSNGRFSCAIAARMPKLYPTNAIVDWRRWIWSSGFNCCAAAGRAVAARANAAIAMFFIWERLLWVDVRWRTKKGSIMRENRETTLSTGGNMAAMRIEKDTFGPIEVPSERLWGAQTQRSLENFRISGERMPAELIQALAWVKRACAAVNESLGAITGEKARAISSAADEVLAGRWPEEFPLVVWQTGSGTQTNMNMNEVLANRASEILGGERGEARRVHPNDDVNRGQSSNDVFPTAMHVAAVVSIRKRLLPALERLRATLAERSEAFRDVVKIGRTHLQDATPLTLGQEFSGYVAQLDHAAGHIEHSLGHLSELALGGTAVGTGLNAHPELA